MVAVVLWAVGGLGSLSLVVLGMTFFGIVYFGMMLVLPHSSTHPNEVGKGELFTCLAVSFIELPGGMWTEKDALVGDVSIPRHYTRPAPAKI